MKCFKLAVAVGVFYIAMAVLNGPALLRAAENMQYDAPARGTFLSLTKPLARFSETIRIDFLRSTTEKFERKHLE